MVKASTQLERDDRSAAAVTETVAGIEQVVVGELPGVPSAVVVRAARWNGWVRCVSQRHHRRRAFGEHDV
jgi:hypothetical protein